MSDKTEIAWTDHTFNPWVGCTKIAPGCDNCYAAEMASRFAGLYGDKTWDGEHYQMAEANWKKPFTWQRAAEKAGIRRRVFCASMADVFDNQASEAARERLWQTIKATQGLDWLVLTKRPTNIAKMLPDDWGDGYPNVWLGTTVENRKHGYPRVDALRAVPAALRFLSVEPLLEDVSDIDLTGIDWVIVGGESGAHFRPMNPQWARDIRDKCRREGVSFFYKQDGGLRGGGHLLDGVQHFNWPAMMTGGDRG